MKMTHDKPTLIVLTCERPNKVSYLRTTLTALNAQGAMDYDRIIVSDGLLTDESIEILGWPVISFPQRSGNVKATWEALKLGKGRDVIMFEDDVIPCNNGLPATVRVKVPSDCAFLSFFNPHLEQIKLNTKDPRQRYTAPKPGISRRAVGKSFAFAQAIKIPSATVNSLIRGGIPQGYNERFSNDVRNGRDSALGMAAAQFTQAPYIGLMVPNWFQHIGHVSAVMSATQSKNQRTEQLTSNNFIYHLDALKWMAEFVS
jgi:hypothetical protein